MLITAFVAAPPDKDTDRRKLGEQKGHQALPACSFRLALRVQPRAVAAERAGHAAARQLRAHIAHAAAPGRQRRLPLRLPAPA